MSLCSQPRRFALGRVGVLIGATLAAFACEKSSSSSRSPQEAAGGDALPAQFLRELGSGEREAMGILCPEGALAELEERDLVVFERTLGWLASFELADEPEAEPAETRAAEQTRRYRLRFEAGELGLELGILGGCVQRFAFEEPAWSSLVERAAQASVGSLRIESFEFVDAQGRSIPRPADAAAIDYSLALEGLDAQLREHHLSIEKVVRGPEGRVVYRQEQPDELRFAQSEVGASGGRVTGSVAVPGPGRYELELVIADLVAASSLTYRQTFVIE